MYRLSGLPIGHRILACNQIVPEREALGLAAAGATDFSKFRYERPTTPPTRGMGRLEAKAPRPARGANPKDARQGARGGGANRSQGEILNSFDGGNQPNRATWVAWLQELGLTELQARRWLAKWGDDLGWDEVDRRLQRIRDAGPTGQGGLNDRMIAEGAVREPGQADVARRTARPRCSGGPSTS